jgi:hypothetical protein
MFKLSGILQKTNHSSIKHIMPAAKAAVHKVPAVLKIDTANVSIKHFNDVAIDNYKKSAEFNYHTVKAGIGWWERFWTSVWYIWLSFWGWVASIFEKIFGSSRAGQNSALVFKYVILGLAAVALVYIIFKLLGIDAPLIFKRKPKSIPLPYAESVENIHEISFDQAIEDALANKNYRLAVRLLYLRCLKELSDGGLINWRTEKTNTAYINELNNDVLRRQFTMVTRQFEYIWYGNFPVDGQSYQQINNIFLEFKQSLS